MWSMYNIYNIFIDVQVRAWVRCVSNAWRRRCGRVATVPLTDWRDWRCDGGRRSAVCCAGVAVGRSNGAAAVGLAMAATVVAGGAGVVVLLLSSAAAHIIRYLCAASSGGGGRTAARICAPPACIMDTGRTARTRVYIIECIVSVRF